MVSGAIAGLYVVFLTDDVLAATAIGGNFLSKTRHLFDEKMAG